MKKNYNNVWTWPYRPRYYLTHPWYWFRQFWRNCKASYQRIVYGWCPWDVWDMDCWIIHTFPPMLRYMAEHGSAYPGHEPFETPERWHEWLNKMADLIESGDEDKQNTCNEFYPEYIKFMDDSRANKDYFNRAQEIMNDAEDNLEIVMTQIGKHFYDLWD